MSEHDDLQALIDAASPALAVDAGVARAGAERFEARVTWQTELRRRARIVRRLLVVGAVVYAVLMGVITMRFVQAAEAKIATGTVHFTIWRALAFELVVAVGVPLGLAGATAFLVGRTRFRAQLGARAILWALTLLAGLVQVLMLQTLGGRAPDPGGFPLTGASVFVATLTCIGALWVLGEQGLRPPDSTPFQPVAFRRLLTLSLVMGLADAVIIGTVFVLIAAAGRFEPIWLGLGLVLSIAAYGLARLRTWGLAAMALGNLGEVALALAGQLTLLGPLVALLMLTAVVQLMLPVPVYAAMLRGRAPEGSDPRWVRYILPSVLVLVGVMAVVQFGWACVA